jgi:hypothetical protein
MYQKGNKHYADWRDASGIRRRKSFPTALGATRHENAQKRLRPTAGEPLPTNSPRSFSAPGHGTKATGGSLPAGRSLPLRRESSFPTSASPTSERPRSPMPTIVGRAAAPLTSVFDASSQRCTIKALQTSAKPSTSRPRSVPAKPSPRKRK